VINTADKVGAVITPSKSPEEFVDFFARERLTAVNLLKDIGMLK
jgi:hypothetical protein